MTDIIDQYIEDFLNFIGIFSDDDTSVNIEQVKLALQMGYDVSSMYVSSEPCVRILTFLYASFLLMRQKLITVTKTGITDWSLNQVTIRFDVNSVKATAEDFKREWDELRKACEMQTQADDVSFEFTNEGTGYWQPTQRRQRPLYLRIGGGT